jgi:ubiquitin
MVKSSFLGVFVGALLLLSPAVAVGQAEQLTPEPLSQTKPQGEMTGEITRLELQQFVQILKQVQNIDKQMQQKMAKAIKAEGLTPQRFVEIGQRQENTETPLTTEISEKELSQFERALAKLKQIEQEAIPLKERAVIAQGLTLERFSQIGQKVNQDPSLQKQVQQMLENR